MVEREREEAHKMKTLALHTHTLVTHSSRKDKRLRRRERERSFEQGVKRFSCLIQPPRKLSKTKDPSRDYCTHVLSMLWELKMKLFLKISQFLLQFLPLSISLNPLPVEIDTLGWFFVVPLIKWKPEILNFLYMWYPNPGFVVPT